MFVVPPVGIMRITPSSATPSAVELYLGIGRILGSDLDHICQGDLGSVWWSLCRRTKHSGTTLDMQQCTIRYRPLIP